jgi:hypothetical protein
LFCQFNHILQVSLLVFFWFLFLIRTANFKKCCLLWQRKIVFLSSLLLSQTKQKQLFTCFKCVLLNDIIFWKFGFVWSEILQVSLLMFFSFLFFDI